MAKEKIYPYAVARVRMLERYLLTEKEYIQMTEARGIEEALRILADMGYGEGQLSVKNYEAALSSHIEKAYLDVAELAGNLKFIDIFRLKNDYHNLKVLIKEELSGVDGSAYLIGGGSVDIEVLKSIFRTKAMELLPSEMKAAVEKAYDSYGKTMNGQMIDVILDQAAFKQMKSCADSSNNEFIKQYMVYTCDMTNFKSVVRIKNMGKTFEWFSEIYVQGGSVSLDEFRKAFTSESFETAFKGTSYASLAEAMAGGFTVFEKQCDNFIMEFIRNAKYKSLTIEPLLAYIYAVEAEVKMVRIILNGKGNDFDSEAIKEKLRIAYV